MNLRYYLQVGKGLRKFFYYIGCAAGYAVPRSIFRHRLHRAISCLSAAELAEANRRAGYYNRMMPTNVPQQGWTRIGDYRYPWNEKQHFSTYFFELDRCVKYFDADARFDYLFGDIIHEPELPAFVKSRPITDGATNSVVLKLDKIRHFNFISDPKAFADKKDMLVSRNVVRQPHRRLLLEKYFGHPLCDLGQVNTDTDHPEWITPYMTMSQQLDYKFIACTEGNDVATNLKWVMSSNSIAVMPAPRYETWFMEGSLVPGVHYIEVLPDYSDLEAKLQHYIDHPDEALAIIENAHRYVDRFRNRKVERATGLLVVKKYLELTGQLTES